MRITLIAVALLAGACRGGVTTGPISGMVGDFDAGAPTTPVGEWQQITDRIQGGTSTETMTVAAGGAKGTPYALDLRGTVFPHAPLRFAGATLHPGAGPYDTGDLSGATELVFQARSTSGQAFAVWLLTPSNLTSATPDAAPFTPGPTWQEFRVPFSAFQGSRGAVLGLFFGATAPGPFDLQLDQIEVG